MPASTNLIGDVGTVYSNGPSSTTQANAIAAAGPINDYIGNTQVLQKKLQEASVLLTTVKGNTDAGSDGTNLGLINGILAALNGTGSPSSHVIADIGTVITNGPSSTTQANAIAAAGRIEDYIGNCNIVKTMLQGALVLIKILKGVTDAGSDGTNNTLLANVILTLS